MTRNWPGSVTSSSCGSVIVIESIVVVLMNAPAIASAICLKD